jgi:PEP-CTERM/exosortase A-associated glycosyltransferase
LSAVYGSTSRYTEFAVRILHVLDHSIPLQSGYSFRTLAILRQQRALGWETFHVTSTKHTAAAAPVENVDGLTFYRTVPEGRWAERFPVLEQLAVISSLQRRLARLIPELKPDIIHAHSPCLNGIAALREARRHAVPLVYELRALWEDGAVDHGTATRGGLRYRISRALETWVLRRADAVTTICEGLRGEILSRDVPEDKVTVIPNAVDPTRFTDSGRADKELARSLGLEGARVLGFIGSFYGYEGLSLLLGALPSLLRRMPSVRVLLVGGGYEEDALKRQAAYAGVADKVVFAGQVAHDRVQEYYNLVDVFVYPRKSTRLTELVTPLKPLEAMAQGRAVVASDIGGHRELIRPRETGLLFRADDPDSLVAAVLELLEHPELSAAMRASARRFVEAERNWKASVGRYAAIYSKLHKNHCYGVAA